MINQKRRTLLSGITAATATVALPTAACAFSGVGSNKPVSAGSGLELSFKRLGDATTVQVTNNTATEVSLKHVYPGIVHAQGSTFDINSLLSKHPLTVQPGQTQTLPIQSVVTAAKEQALPHGLSFGKSLKVTTQYNSPGKRWSVDTLRTYLT